MATTRRIIMGITDLPITAIMDRRIMGATTGAATMGVPITAADRMPLGGVDITPVDPGVGSLLSEAAACVVAGVRVGAVGNR